MGKCEQPRSCLQRKTRNHRLDRKGHNLASGQMALYSCVVRSQNFWSLMVDFPLRDDMSKKGNQSRQKSEIFCHYNEKQLFLMHCRFEKNATIQYQETDSLSLQIFPTAAPYWRIK